MLIHFHSSLADPSALWPLRCDSAGLDCLVIRVVDRLTWTPISVLPSTLHEQPKRGQKWKRRRRRNAGQRGRRGEERKKVPVYKVSPAFDIGRIDRSKRTSDCLQKNETISSVLRNPASNYATPIPVVRSNQEGEEFIEETGCGGLNTPLSTVLLKREGHDRGGGQLGI